MNYPGGPSGYGPPPRDQPTPNWGAPSPRPRTSRGPAFILTIVVGVLGVLSFLLGLAPYADLTEIMDERSSTSTDDQMIFLNDYGSAGIAGISLLLAAGLLALFSVVPAQSGNRAVIAGLSTTGFIALVFALLALDGISPKVGLILGLLLAFAQSAAAIAALLIDAGVLRSGTRNAYSPVDARPRGGPPPSGGAPSPYRGPGQW